MLQDSQRLMFFDMIMVPSICGGMMLWCPWINPKINIQKSGVSQSSGSIAHGACDENSRFHTHRVRRIAGTLTEELHGHLQIAPGLSWGKNDSQETLNILPMITEVSRKSPRKPILGIARAQGENPAGWSHWNFWLIQHPPGFALPMLKEV